MPNRLLRGLSAIILYFCLQSPVYAQQPVAGEQRYALVIGNSAYTTTSKLPNPVNDATDMAGQLRKLGFSVSLVTNGSYTDMREAAQKFFSNLSDGPTGKTTGLFYYAGHGLQYQNENYLVPIDANVTYEDDIPRTCFSVQRIVLDNMARTNSNLNIVILDACRNNPFPASSRSVSNGLAEVQKAKGSFIAYATAPGSVASDGTGRNGLYTQELLKAMDIPNLQIEQVFKVVRRNVLFLSNEKQYTWDSSNILGDFYFIPPGESGGQVVATATPAPPANGKQAEMRNAGAAASPSAKIISDEQLAKQLTDLTSSAISFAKRKANIPVILKNFVVPHAFVNIMIGKQLDERVAANKLLDRLITLPESSIKVLQQEVAASGRIIELTIELEE